MNIIPKHMESRFKKMTDEIIEFSQFDTELADELRWIDLQSREKNMDFYEMMYLVLSKYGANKMASDWMKSKSNDKS